MSRRTLAKLLLVLISTVFGLAALEVAGRVLAKRDADGNVKIGSTRLKPLHVPVRKAEQVIAQYLQSRDSPLIYDAELGWSQRPGTPGHNAAGFISGH